MEDDVTIRNELYTSVVTLIGTTLYIQCNFKEKLVEDRDTVLELTGKIQELKNEINCMNDSRDFQDAESVRSGNSHVH